MSGTDHQTAEMTRQPGQRLLAAEERYAPYLLVAILGSLTFSRFVAEVIVVAFCLYFLARSFYLRDWAWLRSPPVAVALAGWLLLVLYVSPLALDPLESWRRSLPWIRVVILLGGLLHIVLSDADRIRRALWPVFPVFAFITFDLYYQDITGASINGMEIQSGRLTSILNRPNASWFFGKGYFGCLALATAITLGLAKKANLQTWGYLLLAPPLFAATPLTGDRSATLLIAASLLGCLAVMIVNAPRHRAKIALVLLALLAAYAWFLSQDPFIVKRVGNLVTDISNFRTSHYGNIAAAAWRMILEDPWSGLGFNVFEAECAKLQAEGVVRLCSSHSHNSYLHWAVVGGLPGLVAWIALGATLCWPGLLLLKDKRTRLAAAFGLACLMITFFPLRTSQNPLSNWPALLAWTSFAMSYAAFLVMRRGEKQDS